MSTIYLRPDLRTSGGEIHDILLNGRYAGNMSLVYRESDRIGGAVQLDRTMLSEEDQERVISFVQDYIQELIYAVRAVDCDVIVTSGEYERVIATNRDEAGRRKSGGELSARIDEDPDVLDPEEDATIGDEDAEHLDPLEMEEGKAAYYELVVVDQSGEHVSYQVYDEENRFVAEAEFSTRGPDCFGEVRFRFLPGEDEIEAVTDLIVSDFDEEEIDTIEIRVLHQGQELERIELTHEDLENEADAASDHERSGYIVTLARDDGDMLTYEIHDAARGGTPIGTATVDIAQRELTGFMEFSDPVGEEVREEVAMALMRELDKEKDYRSLNLSVMHGNVKVDELMFEAEPVH